MHLCSVPLRPLHPFSGSKNNSTRVSRPFSRRQSRFIVYNKGQESAREGDDDDGDDRLKRRSTTNDDDVDAKKQPQPSDPNWTTGQAADAAYGWSDEFSAAILRRASSSSTSSSSQSLITDLPLSKIRRPLARSRADDELKVVALAASMREHGQREPIDVLECPPGSGKYYGFSGCHRFAAARSLGWETIRCRVRKVSEATLRMHLA